MKGVVVKFDASRGFGFIRCEDANQPKDAFVHISNIQDSAMLEVGQSVIFDLEQSDKGPVAVRVVAGAKRKSPIAWFGMAATIFVAVFMLGVSKLLPSESWLFAYLISINLATIFFYFYDKKAAGHPEYTRVPELILHSLAFFGGTPAAFLSQYFFRHKTIKGKFRIVFWIIFVIQVVAICQWLIF